MIWFTSDPHFGHANIIRFCSRPFRDCHHMWITIRDNWNKVVKPEDTVYVLGDFSFRTGPVEMRFMLDELNGRKILIAGNHDQDRGKYRSAGFVAVLEGALIKLGHKIVRLSHFPYQGTGPKQYAQAAPHDDGGWLVCGHVHEHWVQKGKMINVGVDVWNFSPVPEQKIHQMIEEYDKRIQAETLVTKARHEDIMDAVPYMQKILVDSFDETIQKLQQVNDTPQQRSFWDFVEETSKKVAKWPWWKK